MDGTDQLQRRVREKNILAPNGELLTLHSTLLKCNRRTTDEFQLMINHGKQEVLQLVKVLDGCKIE